MPDNCMICGKPVEDYDPKYCCSGHLCGCQGQPTEPCVCSGRCYDAVMDGIGMPYEERRIKAGIERWRMQ